MQKVLSVVFYNKWTAAFFITSLFLLVFWGCSKLLPQQVEGTPTTEPQPVLQQENSFPGYKPNVYGEKTTDSPGNSPNTETVINQCSPEPDSFATAREGPGLEFQEMAPIENGTRVKILEVVNSNEYDFTPGSPGCGSNVRVKVEVLEGTYRTQVSWVHGSTVEGVAK